MPDDLKFHPLTELFPLMEGADFDALVADVKVRRLLEPITIFERMILDGRNRFRACLAAGVTPKFKPFEGGAYIDATDYVISKNIHRRHLTGEQKRELIAKLLKANPEKSDRQIAETIKASPTTVGTVRAKLEESGEVSKLDTRTDAKGVKQPAKKKTKKADGKPSVKKPIETGIEEERREPIAAEISRFAYKLIQLDIGLARELHRLLWEGGDPHRLMIDLGAGIEIEESVTLVADQEPTQEPDHAEHSPPIDNYPDLPASLDRNRVPA
jgi:hypothetical protein